MNPALLATEYRGGIPDNLHRGHLAVVDTGGRVIFSLGDPQAVVFYRSASKPIQALPAIAARLDERYGLTDAESAIFSGSHAGEAYHMEALESIFRKAGLAEEHLIMNPAAPAHKAAEQARIEAGLPKSKLWHNCAGKHAALMLLQRHLGGPVQDYWRAGSRADGAVHRAIEAVGQGPIAAQGLDGCGVPVFAVPVAHIATAFRNLARPQLIGDTPLAEAAARYIPRLNANPRMLRGNGFLCGHLSEDANIIAKGGAAGVYGLGLKAQGLGMAFKVESGSESAWPCIIRALLRRFDALSPQTEAMLLSLGAGEARNDNGAVSGEICPAEALTGQIS